MNSRIMIAGVLLVLGWWLPAEAVSDPTAPVRAEVQAWLNHLAQQPEATRVAAFDKLVHRGACRAVQDYYRTIARQLTQPTVVNCSGYIGPNGFDIVYDRFGLWIQLGQQKRAFRHLVYHKVGGCHPNGCFEIVPSRFNRYEHWRHGHDDEEGMRRRAGSYYENDDDC